MKRIKSLFLVTLLTPVLAGCGLSTDHVHTFDMNTWKTNSNQHWHPATCGHNVANNVANHVDANNDKVCDVCGYVLGEDPSHTHTFSSVWSLNETKHWHSSTCGHDVKDSEGNHIDSDNDGYCDVCKYKLPEHVHTFSNNWTYNAEKHWHSATCGHDVKDSEGNHVDLNSDGLCDTCSYQMQVHIHTFSPDWSSDASNHWHAATCGHDVKDAFAAHSDQNSDGKCDICSYQMPNPPVHEHTFASDWSSNETEHWHSATCGHDVKGSLGNHIDLNSDSLCDVCGHQMPVHIHTFSTQWSSNTSEHWHTATCGHDVKDAVGLHIDNNSDGYCDVCSYKMGISVTKIAISGNVTKLNYSYDDDWDFSELSVKATYSNKTTAFLDSSEYTLTPNKAKPRNYTTSLTVTATYNADKSITATKTIKNITVADEVYDEAAEITEYYKDCKLTGTGNTLMNELHRHSFSKHTYFVKYGETTSYLSKSKDAEAPDLVPGEHKIVHFYTANKTDYYAGTREHVWACNDSSGLWPHGVVDESSYIGGGSDLYHIRPSDSKVNTARGDAPFVDFDDSEFSSKRSSVVEFGDKGPYKIKLYGAEEVSEGVYEYAHLVEPDDVFKGDIARIVAYIYMHYNSFSGTPSGKSSMVGSLDLTKVIGFSTVSKVKKILKEWNELDPPDEVEKRRNHTVQQIQGNRNPFVDYPNLMDSAF